MVLGDTEHIPDSQADAKRVEQSLSNTSAKGTKVTIVKDDVTQTPNTNTKNGQTSAESESKQLSSITDNVSRK